MIEKTELIPGWTLSCNDTGRPELPDRTFRPSVPGCVHTDLLCGTADPRSYLDVNEITNDWIGRSKTGLPSESSTLMPDEAGKVQRAGLRWT